MLLLHFPTHSYVCRKYGSVFTFSLLSVVLNKLCTTCYTELACCNIAVADAVSRSTCFRSSSAALLDGSPLADPRLLARACCSLACSRASARSLRSLSRCGGGGGGSGGAGASLPWAPVLGLGLSLVPALFWLWKTGKKRGNETIWYAAFEMFFFLKPIWDQKGSYSYIDLHTYWEYCKI